MQNRTHAHHLILSESFSPNWESYIPIEPCLWIVCDCLIDQLLLSTLATPCTQDCHSGKYIAHPISTSRWQIVCLPDCYRSVPHIRPPFCNLSASRKRRGGLYAGSDILSHEYAPSSGATPRCWHRTLYYRLLVCYRSWFDNDLPSLFLSSRNSMVKIDWQRLATA